MDIFREVRDLGLPWGHYVVFGAGPLAAHGIRPTNDVDLFVTNALYEQLRRAGWEEQELVERPGERYLAHGIYEADDTWRYGEYDPTPEAVIAGAEIINGVPFAPLGEVLRWKRAWGRPKDLVDVGLIEAYLNSG